MPADNFAALFFADGAPDTPGNAQLPSALQKITKQPISGTNFDDAMLAVFEIFGAE